MSKTNIAIIRLVLRKNKTLSDGSHPIMLRCSFHGLKEVSTSYTSVPRYWDEKNMCIKKGYSPNYLFINAQLRKLYDAAISRRDRYIADGINYTAAMVLRDEPVLSRQSTLVSDLIDRYVIERGVSPATATTWWTLRNLVREYDSGIILEGIDNQWARAFSSWLMDRGNSDGTIRLRLSQVAALWRYGVELGLVSMEYYPFRRWDFKKSFAASMRMTYINYRAIEQMKEWFLGKVCYIEEGSYQLREGIVEKCLDPYSRDVYFSMFFFLLDYVFQGLSPVDIAGIRWSEVETRIVGGKDMLYWSGNRRKTGKRVVVMFDKGSRFNRVLIEILGHRSDKVFMLPFLDGYEKDSVKVQDLRLKRLLEINMKRLVRGCDEVNGVIKVFNTNIVKENLEAGKLDINDGTVPLIPGDITWYSARHSFAMAYMTHGGNPLQLATLMGKSVSTLHQYVETLSHEGDLAEAVAVMP